MSFSLFIPPLTSLHLFETYLRLSIIMIYYYEHFLCLFASLRWIASCIPQL